MTVENGKQFRILPNKRAFNQSAYQTLRSVKHSLIKRPIIHLLTSKASMFLNCQILFLFNYVMLMFFYKADTKGAWVTKSKGASFIISAQRCVFTTTVYICVNACIPASVFGILPALRIPRWYKARVFQEKLNSVKLAGLDKAITLTPHLKRTHYFVLESVELYC